MEPAIAAENAEVVPTGNGTSSSVPTMTQEECLCFSLERQHRAFLYDFKAGRASVPLLPGELERVRRSYAAVPAKSPEVQDARARHLAYLTLQQHNIPTHSLPLVVQQGVLTISGRWEKDKSEPDEIPEARKHRLTQALLENDGIEKVQWKTVDVLYNEAEIALRIQEMAGEITRDYPDPEIELCLVGVMQGAVQFVTELLRAIDRPTEFYHVEASSYKNGRTSSGTVDIREGKDMKIKGKDVLIVEDIIDTGNTLDALVTQLAEKYAPRSLNICVLLDKSAHRQKTIGVKYRGFEIEDHWVVGFGMDDAEKYRNLPYIGVLNHQE